MKPCADFTFDHDADTYVVMMDDGTEVCRTRAPMVEAHLMAARSVAHWMNMGELVLAKDGLHMDEMYRWAESMVDFCFPVTYHKGLHHQTHETQSNRRPEERGRSKASAQPQAQGAPDVPQILGGAHQPPGGA